MPRPIALCLEDLEARTEDARFLRCVALGGRQPGLRLASDGMVRWQDTAPSRAAGDASRSQSLEIPAELWVSADDQLILYRPADAAPMVVDRMGRRLDVPYDKPVVLLDGDQLELAGRRLRVHVHGAAGRVHGPEPLPARSRTAQRLAAAVVVVGAAVASCEVRNNPPEPPIDTSRSHAVPVPTGPPDSGGDDAATSPDGGRPADPSGGPAADAGAKGSPTGSGRAAVETPGASDSPSTTSAATAKGSTPPVRPAPKAPKAAPKPKPIEVRDFPPYM